MAIDLHMHSSFSTDGHDEPEDFVRFAASRNLKAIALTEHSSTGSLPRARKAAEEAGIEYINGIEIGGHLMIDDGPAEADFLGYFFDYPAPAIERVCERQRETGRRRTEAFLAGLAGMGIGITREDVSAEYAGAVSGWAIRRMLRDRGLARDRRHSFLIEKEACQRAGEGDPRFASVLDEKVPARDVIEAIHRDGGLVFMAHPFWLTKPSRGGHAPDAVWRQIRAALDLGVDGLEAVNASNDAGYADAVRTFCVANGLPASGGSDAHRASGAGEFPVDDALLDSMKNVARGKPPWPPTGPFDTR